MGQSLLLCLFSDMRGKKSKILVGFYFPCYIFLNSFWFDILIILIILKNLNCPSKTLENKFLCWMRKLKPRGFYLDEGQTITSVRVALVIRFLISLFFVLYNFLIPNNLFKSTFLRNLAKFSCLGALLLYIWCNFKCCI